MVDGLLWEEGYVGALVPGGGGVVPVAGEVADVFGGDEAVACAGKDGAVV